MNGICGWVGSEISIDASQDNLTRMLHVLSRNGGFQQRKCADCWGVGLAAVNDGLIDIHAGKEIVSAIIGRPHFMEPELELVRLQKGAARTLADVFASVGEQAFAKLSGAFGAIIINPTRRSAAIAIDRMGVYSLTHAVAGGSFLFSTSCDAINAHPDACPEIDVQAIYNYLYFHMIPAPATIYRDYRRLLPGEYAVFETGSIRHGQYWSMRFAEGERAPFADLKEEFITELRDAVREASTGNEVGCFLSGGTDSSTMAGLLGQVSGAPARTYSIGFDEPGYDEMNFARLAAKHFGTDHHEYYVTPDDIVAAIPLIADIYDQPFGNSSAVPTYYCARMASRDGIERLIGGDGGDELFGGNERYAKQYVFSLYENVPQRLRTGFLSPLLAKLPIGVPVLSKAKSYVEQAAIPMPARLETYNLLDRIGRERMFTPEFLSQINGDAPLLHIDGIYRSSSAQSLINRMLSLDFRLTLADNDLPKVVNACALANMEVAFPMLGDGVVAFSARLAPDLKLKGTKLRYFFKEALRGFLPDEIITKQKHGFGLPFGHWLTKHHPLQGMVADSLRQLKGRGIVNPAFLDDLITDHLSAHAGYYGTMVWVLMMLELWLQKHGQLNFRISSDTGADQV